MNNIIRQTLVVVATLVFGLSAAFALDINRASVEELQTVKGVGPVIAKRIASERRKSKFKSMADLQDRVPGVGPQIATSLSKGSGLPKGKSSKSASKSKTSGSKSAKKAKGKVTEVADKGRSAKSKTKKVAKANTKSASKKAGKSKKKVAAKASKSRKTATKKLAKKVSNKKK
ncbi:MAG: ComEA family DNA-binding protein [Burkholderiaceae bacterium]